MSPRSPRLLGWPVFSLCCCCCFCSPPLLRVLRVLGAFRRRPIEPSLFRFYYDRGDIPLSVDHCGSGTTRLSYRFSFLSLSPSVLLALSLPVSLSLSPSLYPSLLPCVAASTRQRERERPIGAVQAAGSKGPAVQQTASERTNGIESYRMLLCCLSLSLLLVLQVIKWPGLSLCRLSTTTGCFLSSVTASGRRMIPTGSLQSRGYVVLASWLVTELASYLAGWRYVMPAS